MLAIYSYSYVCVVTDDTFVYCYVHTFIKCIRQTADIATQQYTILASYSYLLGTYELLYCLLPSSQPW